MRPGRGPPGGRALKDGRATPLSPVSTEAGDPRQLFPYCLLGLLSPPIFLHVACTGLRPYLLWEMV